MKLEINYNEKNWKAFKHLEASLYVINSKWFNNKIKEGIKSYLETNENKYTAPPNLWDAVKALLRRKFIALQVYLKKKKISNKKI